MGNPDGLSIIGVNARIGGIRRKGLCQMAQTLWTEGYLDYEWQPPQEPLTPAVPPALSTPDVPPLTCQAMIDCSDSKSVADLIHFFEQ